MKNEGNFYRKENTMKNFNYLKEVKENLRFVIDLHSKMKNSFVENSPSKASSRRSYERQNSYSYVFQIGDVIIDTLCTTRCSAANIYYKGVFYIDDQKVTVAKLKSIYEALDVII
ncbi:MAG: hypothetical protein ACW98X_25440 [Promethearchaeota archaeon]